MHSLGIYFLFCIWIMGCTPQIADQVSINTSDLADRQLQNVAPLYTIKGPSKYFAVDKLNQLYIVGKKNEIVKYDSKGKEVFRYNNNFLDELALIDPTDPFNLLLYYPDFLTVISLDRTMNKTGEFDISDLNLLAVKAIGTSNDNNVWLYDELTFRLKKVNRNSEVLQQSPDMNIILNRTPKPVFLIERENTVYLSDPELGILIFNVFGGYESLIEIQGVSRFQVFGKQLYYQKEGKLFSYHLQTLNNREVNLPFEITQNDQVLVQKRRAFVMRSDQIEVYEIKKAED